VFQGAPIVNAKVMSLYPVSMTYLKLVITMMLWGGTFVAGRVVAQEMGPFAAAFSRFLVASIALITLTVVIEGKLPRLPKRLWLRIMLLGLTGILAYNAFFFAGLKTVSAGRAALIIALNPVAIALGSALWFKETITRIKALGIALSLLGAVVVISGGNPLEVLQGRVGPGELMILGCVISWMGFTLIGKTVMADLSPYATTTYACMAGTALLLLPALGNGLLGAVTEASGVTWLAVSYLGILGSALGFSWYYSGVRQIGPARASVFINLVPIFAIVLAALLLQEQPSPTLLLGGVLVIAGVMLTNR
jgi:drug/metabolite transporter (DMT)-like permease